MTLGLVSVGIYLLGLPLVLRLIGFLQLRFVVDKARERALKMKKKGRTKPVKIPEEAWPRWSRRIRFAFVEDKRKLSLKKSSDAEATPGGPSRRMLIWILYLVGLALAAAPLVLEGFTLPLIGYALFFVTVVTAIVSADFVIRTRDVVMQRMVDIARQKLTVKADTPTHEVVTGLQWRDMIHPAKVTLHFPVTFSADGTEEFMRQFNQVFGLESAWVPDVEDRSDPGWDFGTGKVKLKTVPPLPTSAPWDEHYVLAEGVSPDFFPLALGVENGLELPNPKTGKVENVLGIDLAGTQKEYAEKAGLTVSDTLSRTPMALVGGGTGGGKSLPVNTPVTLLEPGDYDPSELG